MQGGDRFQCLNDIETTVHEINHAITSGWSYEYCRQNKRIFTEKDMYYFYIGQANEIPIFSNVDYFPSRELMQEIPEERRTFRFNMYINGTTSN